MLTGYNPVLGHEQKPVDHSAQQIIQAREPRAYPKTKNILLITS